MSPTTSHRRRTARVPVNGTVNLCSIAASVAGSSSATCTGAQTANLVPVGQPGSQSTGATVPVSLCGLEGAADGSASAACPEPSTSANTTPPVSGTSAPAAGGGSGQTGATGASAGTIPATLTANPGTASATAAVTPAGALAQTGAPLLLEIFLGAVALLAGLVLRVSGRLRRSRDWSEAERLATE